MPTGAERFAEGALTSTRPGANRPTSGLITGKAATQLAQPAVYAVGGDYGGVINTTVIPNCRGIVRELTKLHSEHASELPPLAATALETFLRTQANFEGLSGWPGLQFAIGALGSFRAEFTYLLADTEAVARSLTLRAFTHLQRSIVADETVAARWRSAFAESQAERACEKLGAVHLLLLVFGPLRWMRPVNAPTWRWASPS